MQRWKTAAALLALAFTVGQEVPGATAQQQLTFRGTTNLSSATPPATDGLGPETHIGPEFDARFERLAKGAISPSRVPADHVPRPADSVLAGFTAGSGFDGVNHRDQPLASGGNQFSSEPPDQGLAVGNGYVLETVNTAIRVRRTDGSVASPTIALNEFFKLAPAINRTTGVFGPFT